MESLAPAPSSNLRDPLDTALAATSWAVGLAFLAIYLSWTPAAAGFGDSSEFTLVLATLGLAHPTGYVLYTWLGHAAVSALHAAGVDWAWATNAWSALGGAVAIGLLHRFGVRLLRRAEVAPPHAAGAALLAVAALGLNPAWSAPMVVAEVYGWHLAWVAGACLFAWSTCEGLADGRSDAWRARRVLGWSVLVGVGVSHHATSVLIALPLTVALLVSARRFRAAWLGLVATAIVPPLSAWGYVVHRSTHPAAFQWQALGPGAHQAWLYVSGAGYWHFLGSFAPSPQQRAVLGAEVFPWLAAGLAAVLVWPFLPGRQPRAIRWALAGAAVLQTAYSLLYGVTDPVSYFLPALAIGLSIVPTVIALTAARRLALPLAILAVSASGFLAWRWNGVALDRKANYERAEPFLHDMWRSIPFGRGYVIWDDDMSSRLIMYQHLNGEKPGLHVLSPLLLLDDTARSLFARRHGFDPVAGLAIPGEDEPLEPARMRMLVLQIAEGINRRTPDPVLMFMPQEPSIRLLPKRGMVLPATPGGTR